MELYVSTDIEADGPCPGPNSMLSFASAVFDGENETPIDTFTVNLYLLDEAVPHPDTTKFWQNNLKAYEATRVALQWPENAMCSYVAWLKQLGGRPVFVGYPAAFDSLFIFWYLHKFAGENPFGWQALDIKTYAAATLQKPFLRVVKNTMPGSWVPSGMHTHVALDDAIEQGIIFTRMLKANRSRRDR